VQRRNGQCPFAELATFESFAVTDAPDGAVPIFADEKAAVFGDGDSD
jgi:hypothetical protein